MSLGLSETVHAGAVHQLPISVGRTSAVEQQRMVPAGMIPSTAPRLHWLGLAVAGASLFVMAMAIAPHFRLPADPSDGNVLGVAASQPLRVTINVKSPMSQATINTVLMTGTVAEALGRAATALRSNFTYVSRGSSVYLASFLNRSPDASGGWVVEVNGQQMTDLSLWSLNQGDVVTVTWL